VPESPEQTRGAGVGVQRVIMGGNAGVVLETGSESGRGIVSRCGREAIPSLHRTKTKWLRDYSVCEKNTHMTINQHMIFEEGV
jgi:hypothetical protein